jgi:hypothetical protein
VNLKKPSATTATAASTGTTSTPPGASTAVGAAAPTAIEPPALRQVSTADLMCCPVAQALASSGEARFSSIVKWKSCIVTLPAPAPPP